MQQALLASGVSSKLYVDDVFSAYTYTGNDSTQTITNGIDLAGNGGMVWIKGRGTTALTHAVYDTVRGAGTGPLPTQTKTLGTDSTDAEGVVSSVGVGANADYLSAFTSTGFTVTAAGSPTYCKLTNGTGGQPNGYVSWTFRKAPKFFDVVTYTGDGATNRNIIHSLGVTPGMVIVKRTDTSSNWKVGVRGPYYLELNTTATDGQYTGGYVYVPSNTATTFNVNQNAADVSAVNATGGRYVAYLFAHDTGPDGLIQCGSFTVPGPGVDVDVNLGWEAQFVLTKVTNQADNWAIGDVMRGMDQLAIKRLMPNLSNAEDSITSYWTQPTATGFKAKGFSNGGTYIYLAIRRPNKPPTTGTQVYNALTRIGTGSVPWKTGDCGFIPDMAIMCDRTASGNLYASYDRAVIDRLRNASEHIQMIDNSLENGGWGGGHHLNMNGYDGLYSADSSYWNASGVSFIDYFFKRAPGVFDVVCYTGNGTTNLVNHSLGIAPELCIFKSRSNTSAAWNVWHISYGQLLNLNSTAAGGFSFALPVTASTIDVTSNCGNNPSVTHVAYLFATCPGISKVGKYTGNGSSQTIACGFSTGARFVLIKRTDSTGDWYVWDTTRGIVSANDRHLSFNTSAVEVSTDDSIDPDTSGFIVNQVAATNINVISATYIYLAIA